MAGGRRTVLIVGPMFDHCDFAPSPARRLRAYARHLPSFGWRAMVLAAACRCTLADYGSPPVGGIVGSEEDVLFDPTDGRAMEAVRNLVARFPETDHAYLALRPILHAPTAFRRWAEWSDVSSESVEMLRSKMSWHLTPTFESGRQWRSSSARRVMASLGREVVGRYVRAHAHQAARARMLRAVVDSALQGAVRPDVVVGSHGYAPELVSSAHAAQRADAPLVAELRDAVTRGWRPLYEAVELGRTARTVRAADAVVHVTREEQRRDAWWLGRRARRAVIQSSFDAEEWESVKVSEDGEIFTLKFLGTLYPKLHLDTFLRGFTRFLERLDDEGIRSVRFHYFGRSVRMMEELTERTVPLRLQGCVQVAGQIPRTQALEEMASATALILPMGEGIPGGRFYEYLGSRRPIAATGSELDPYVAEVLHQTGAGGAAVGADGLADLLYEWWTSWRHGELDLHPDAVALEGFTAERQAGQLAELLSDLLSDPATERR